MKYRFNFLFKSKIGQAVLALLSFTSLLFLWVAIKHGAYTAQLVPFWFFIGPLLLALSLMITIEICQEANSKLTTRLCFLEWTIFNKATEVTLVEGGRLECIPTKLNGEYSVEYNQAKTGIYITESGKKDIEIINALIDV